MNQRIIKIGFKTISSLVALVGIHTLAAASDESANGNKVEIFASFRGNDEDGLYLAYSRDGLKWTALNGDKPLLRSMVGSKIMRNPCLIRGAHGLFHMVWTTGWDDKGIGIVHSKDIISWSKQKFVPVMKHEPNARNCWAPEIIWDPDGKRYMIFWATIIPSMFRETAKRAGTRAGIIAYTIPPPRISRLTRTPASFITPGST